MWLEYTSTAGHCLLHGYHTPNWGERLAAHEIGTTKNVPALIQECS